MKNYKVYFIHDDNNSVSEKIGNFWKNGFYLVKT